MSNDIDVIAPAPTLIAGDSGAVLTAPTPVLSASNTDYTAYLTAPAPTLSADAYPGAAATADINAPAPTLIATAESYALLSIVEAAPLPALSAYIVVGNVGSAVLAAPAPVADMSGVVGNIMSAILTAAVPIMEAVGYPACVITFDGAAPAPQLTAFLAAPVTAAYNTWVLNTRRNALTSYGPEFQFNSYALFNGAVLGCGPSGVVVLGTQADDNGTAIDAIARTGKSDYDRSLLKRVPRLYIDYSTNGDMIFRTITSESGTRSYLLPTNNVIGFQQRRVPIGKGPKAAYWQYEMENVAGADFTTRGIMAYPVMLRRRIM